MKKFQEIVNNQTNSTHSSILDYGLATSGFQNLSNLSLVEEDCIEENKYSTYNVGLDQNRSFQNNDPLSRQNEHYFKKAKNSPDKRKTAQKRGKSAIQRSDEKIRDQKENMSPSKQYRMTSAEDPKYINDQRRIAIADVTNRHSIVSSLNTTAEYEKLVQAGSFISSYPSSNYSSSIVSSKGDQCHKLTLKVKFDTYYGQQLAVVGNIPQLGSWNIQNAYMMTWSEGHVWVADNIVLSEATGDKSYFMYKYVLLHEGHFQKYERGLDRIADVKLLKEQETEPQNGYVLQEKHDENYYISQNNKRSNNGYQKSRESHGPFQYEYKEAPKIKNVMIYDEWEQYHVNFQVFNPARKDGETVRINGDREELGNWWQGAGPQKMKLSTKRYDWMNNEKYGKKVKPYEFNGQKFQNHEQQCPIQIRYNYSRRSSSLDKYTQKEKEFDWEREPCRLIEIQDPNTYQGHKGRKQKNQWLNTSKVWVVNGQINKCDANFKQNFNISEMGRTGVIIGNSPIIEEDVVKLSEKKVTAVLNLQSDVQDLQHMKELYAKYNIYCVENYPIQEFNRTKDLCEKLLWAAKIVNHMLTVLNHEKIYVHCTAGVTRAPSVLLTYLCLFCKVDSWQNPLEVFRFLRRERKVCYPNMKAVVKTISCNRQFQFQQNLLQQAENEQKASIEAAKRHYFLQRAEEQKARLGNFKRIIDERRQIRKEERKARIEKRLAERVRVIKGSMRESVASQIGFKQESVIQQIRLSDELLIEDRSILQYGTPNRLGEGSPIAMMVDDTYDEQCRISPEHMREIKEQIEREESETDEEVCRHEAQVIAQQKRLTRFLEQHEELEQEHLKSSLFRHQFESSENVIRDRAASPQRITIISQDEPFPTSQKQVFELAKQSDSNGVENYYESPRAAAPENVDVTVHTADELSSFHNINDNIEKLLKATHEEIERLDQEEEERNVREQIEREDHKQQLEEIINKAQESARKDLDRLKQIRLEQQSWSSQDGDQPEFIEQVEVQGDLRHDRKKNNLQAKKQSKISNNNKTPNKSPYFSKDVSPRSPNDGNHFRGMSSSCKQHSDSNRSDLHDHDLQQDITVDDLNNKGPSNQGKRASSGINMTDMSQPMTFEQSTTQFDPTTVAHTSDCQELKEEMPFEMCNKQSMIEEQRRERTLEDSMQSNHLDEDTSQLMAMVEKRKTEIEERMSRIDAASKEEQEQVKTSSDEELKVSSDEEQKSNQISRKSRQTNDGIAVPKLEMANIGSFFDNVLSSCRDKDADKIDPRSRLGKDLKAIGLSQEELDKKCKEFFSGADYRKTMVGLKFAPQTDSTLELAIQITLTEQGTKVPVMHLQESLYLIGTDSCHCELRGTKVMVRIGGVNEGLGTYLAKNHQKHLRQLMVSMIKNNETLEQTVERIVGARAERMSELTNATVPTTFAARIRNKREKSPSQQSDKSALTRKSHLMTQSSSKPIVAPKNRIVVDLRGSGMMLSSGGKKPIMTSQTKTPGRAGEHFARLNRSESKWEPQSGRQIITRGSNFTNASKDSGIEMKKTLQKSFTNRLLAKAAGDSGLKSMNQIRKDAQDKSDFDALTMNSQGKSQTAIRASKNAKKNKNKFVLQ